MRALKVALLGIAVVITGACGNDAAEPSPIPEEPGARQVQAVQPPPSASQVAAELKASIPEVVELIDLNEDNDTNNLIGRPNGYVAATVLRDSRTETCARESPGVDCGATVEEWPNAAAAQRRADYIQAVTQSSGLGSQWTYVSDNILLRVTGDLKPSEAEGYEVAFTS